MVAGYFARTLYTLWWLTQNGHEAKGTILFDAEWQGKGGRSYQPVVQYRDESGSMHQFNSRSSSRLPDAGQEVTVRYDPSRPEQRADIGEMLGSMIRQQAGVVALCVILVLVVLYLGGKSG